MSAPPSKSPPPPSKKGVTTTTMLTKHFKQADPYDFPSKKHLLVMALKDLTL